VLNDVFAWYSGPCSSSFLETLRLCLGPSRTSKIVKTVSKYCTIVQYLASLRYPTHHVHHGVMCTAQVQAVQLCTILVSSNFVLDYLFHRRTLCSPQAFAFCCCSGNSTCKCYSFGRALFCRKPALASNVSCQMHQDTTTRHFLLPWE
jgi:hypothetical protein